MLTITHVIHAFLRNLKMDFDSEEQCVSWEYVAKWQMPRIEHNYICVHVPMS